MTTETTNIDTGETTKDGLKYTPILRDGPSERDVIRQFGGLSHFTDSQRADLYSLIEITNESDIDNLDVYRDASKKTLVDLPEYLTQEDNELAEPVQDIIEEYETPTNFLKQFKDEISIPVLSGTLGNPVTYHQYLGKYDEISDEFDQIALRLFVRPTELTDTQKEDLKLIADEIGPDDIILFDLIEVSQLETGDPGRETLQYLCELFSAQTTILLNAFSSYEGTNYNHGPELAQSLDGDGFGDFAINYRFPQDVRLGHIDTRIIRQYSTTESRVFEFRGDGYQGAFEELEDWDLWDPDHCEFCRRANSENTEHLSFWKQVRMGHYISSALTEEAL